MAKTRFLEKIIHPKYPDGYSELFKPEVQSYIKHKMAPEEYINLLSGVYGHDGSDVHGISNKNEALLNSKHNNIKNNTDALRNLILHISHDNNNPDELDSRKHVKSEDAKYLVKKLVENHKISDKAIHYLIDNPNHLKSGYDKNDNFLFTPLANQDLKKEHIDKMLESDTKSSLGNIINNPNFTKDHAKKLIHDRSKLLGSDLGYLLKTKKHNEENKRFIDDKDLEHLLLNKKLSPNETIRALESVEPSKDLLGNEDYSKHKEIVDKIIGLEGGDYNQKPEERDDPELYGYQNWDHGKHRNDNRAYNILEHYDKLTPDQIDHIKRHGDFDDKWALFNNPKIDKNHYDEMYKMWINDESDKGYDLDQFKEKIKEENPYENHLDHYYEQAREKAEERYSFSDYIKDNYNDDDFFQDEGGTDKWLDGYLEDNYEWKDQEGNDIDPEDHPEYNNRRSDADAALEAEIKKRREDPTESIGDSVHEGYDESISEDRYRLEQEMYENDMDEAHLNYDFLPSHLEGKLSSIEEIVREQREKEEKLKEEKRLKETNYDSNNRYALEQESKNEGYLNEHIPIRDDSHEYGNLQHQLEMVKEYADANKGAISIDQLNKAHPNLKDYWKKIFENKNKLSSEELNQKINELPKNKYDIRYDKYDHVDIQNTNRRYQMVFKLNRDKESANDLQQNQEIFDFFKRIHEKAQQHRSWNVSDGNTIGWARVDTNDPKHWLIEEIQSDFDTPIRNYIKDNSGNETLLKQMDSVNKQHGNYREALINKIIKIAKLNGVEKISTHTPESKQAVNKADVIHSSYKLSYQAAPRACGFKVVNTTELPLNEHGKDKFYEGNPSTTSKLDDHLSGLSTHGFMSNAHALLEVDPSTPEENKALHNEMASNHYKMFRKHLDRIKQIDPTHPVAKIRSFSDYSRYHLKGLENSEEEQNIYAMNKEDAIKHVDMRKQGNLQGIPVYGFDSSLNTQTSEGLKGHQLDLAPKSLKKSIDEAVDLIKTELTNKTHQLKIATTLKYIKDNQSLINDLKESNPNAYQSIIDLTQAMIDIYKKKTQIDPEALVQQLEIQEQMEEQQAQMQQDPSQQDPNQEEFINDGSAVRGKKDEPIHRRKLVYAPGSIRNYGPQSARIKDEEGNWRSYGTGLGEPQEGQEQE